MNGSFRLATVDDGDAILDIYAPYVSDTAISLEFKPPSAAEFRERIRSIAGFYPYLVHESDGKIDGYAYATRHAEREGYRYNVTVSVYLRPESRRAGIGRGLYSRLLFLLREQGVVNAYAVITMPNDASVGFHESFGFDSAYAMKRSGWKFGEWRDILWMEKRLRDCDGSPGELRGINELRFDLNESFYDSV